ncbi:efflux RND transporter periplasmic adaptor subunit [Spirosoma areae]
MTINGIYSVLLAGIASAVSCQTKSSAPETKAFALTDTMIHRIRLDSVSVQPVRSELTLVGKVIADENRVVKVFPLVGGNVDNVLVELGDYVHKGQTLAVIHSGEIADFARQNIQAQADLLLAQKNLRVAQDLNESKLNSQREVIQAQKEVEQAQAEQNRVREIYRIYDIGKASTYPVKAPLSGFVIEKRVNRNMQLRSDNTDNLFTIGQISDVWVMGNVNESDIGRVRLGMDATIQTLSYEEVFHGKVDKMYNVLDPGTKSMTVRIKLPNTGLKLKPEMHATVTLRFDEGQRMTTIPAEALIFDHSKNYVMVFHSRTNIQTREVDVLKSLGDVAYIRSGLKPGERIISRNQLLIYDALND